jgi:hypothetical protein
MKMKNSIIKIIREEVMMFEVYENWTEDKLRDLTQNYDNLTDFLKNEKRAANALRRKKLFDEFTSHMTRKQKKYTDEELFQIASKYETITDLKNQRAGVYGAIMSRGMLDKLHQILKPQITNWTDEMLRDEASKYQTLKDFRDNSQSAYITANNRGILDDITSHMPRIKIWTYDEAKKEAKKYEDYNGFAKNSPAFYQSKRNGWLEEFKKFLPLRNTYWTKDSTHIEALKYKTKKEFRDNSPKAYSAAANNGWMDDIDDHFEKVGNKFNRIIYAYEFPDNSVYVGLTYNEKRRQEDHLNLEKAKSMVARHILKTGLNPIFKKLSDFMSQEEAANLESCTIEKYRSDGWTILNKQKGGGLGACKRTELTMEKIKQLTKGFERRVDFKRAFPKEYAIAQKYGWLDDVVADIPIQDRTKWTYEKTKELAKNFKTRAELKYANQSAYHSARKNGWLDDFFPKTEL